MSPSTPISGAGSNGAIVHYRVTRSTNRTIRPGEMFLLDSGAQYPDGTTDVTRTIMVGEATPEMRDRFTRVLKGHIALATGAIPRRHHRHAVGLIRPPTVVGSRDWITTTAPAMAWAPTCRCMKGRNTFSKKR
jgi:hypothetical protein